MFAFHNILVGVELAKKGPSDADALDLVAESAVRRAVWLAKASRSQLTFLSVLSSISRRAELRWQIPARKAVEANASPTSVQGAACNVLSNLVRLANDEGIQADGILASGQGWAEIIRQVLSGKHDLLVIGTHDPHGLRRLLLGSTAQKLLHECPCPVWVSKPDSDAAPNNIMVASDLSTLSDAAVGIGLTIGGLSGAHIHVLNVVNYPLDPQWGTGPEPVPTKTYHQQIRTSAEEELHSQLKRCGQTTGEAVAIHIADGDGMPDDAILKAIEAYDIDLLVLGTVARHGLSGVLLGNTAERLLPEVRCSILAVKPADFRPSIAVAR
jgi:universal stress protein E